MFSGQNGGYGVQGSTGGCEPSGGYGVQGSTGGYGVQGSTGGGYSAPSPSFYQSSTPSVTTFSTFNPSHGHYHTQSYSSPSYSEGPVDLDCCCRII